MSRIVAVAETLADAVQSVGGTLACHAAAGHDVIVIALFDSASESDAPVANVLGLAGVVGAGAEPPAGHGGGAPLPRLAVAIAQMRPDLILAPIGLTGTPAAAAITAALDDLGLPRLRWVDLPYGLSRTPGAPLGTGELLAIPVATGLAAKVAACELLGLGTGERLAGHAHAEGARLGARGPVELLLQP